MPNLDITLTQSINDLAGINGFVDRIVVSITYFGVPCMVLWTVLQWWRGDNRPYRRHVAVTAGIAFLLGLLINQIIVLFIQRVRPYDVGLTQLLVSSSSDPSFPSDHATACFSICFGFLLKRLKREAIFLAAASGLICFSRIYVGTHFLTDVIGGAFTALIAALTVSRLYKHGSRVDTILTNIM